jgi:hypothetical protein
LFLFRQEGTQLQTDPAGAFLFSHAVVGKGAKRNEQTEPVTTAVERNFLNRKWHNELPCN